MGTRKKRKVNMEIEETKKMKIEGFGDFTIVRDSSGFRDVLYKGESIKGVVKATVRAYTQDGDYAVLELEIMENE